MRPIQRWRESLITETLFSSGIIAYPTEGVWGLGCEPSSATAVSRLLRLKQRSPEEGLILIAASILQLEPYLAGIDVKMCNVLLRNWPGPTTYLVPDNGAAPNWIVGRHTTLALRVSTHPIVRWLCTINNGPLVSTSANISGRPSARSIRQIKQYFGKQIDLIVPGDLGGAPGPSKIKNLATGEIVR